MAMIFCKECGKKHSSEAISCPHCGYTESKLHKTNKSIVSYLLLCWFFGAFGAHRFYAGKTGSAVVMLILGITIVGLVITVILALIDFVIGLCNVSTPENIFNNKT